MPFWFGLNVFSCNVCINVQTESAIERCSQRTKTVCIHYGRREGPFECSRSTWCREGQVRRMSMPCTKFIIHRCLAHTLQLAINDSLKVLEEERAVITEVTNYTRRSTIEAQNFKAVQEELEEGEPPARRPRLDPPFTYPPGLNKEVLRRPPKSKGPIKFIVKGKTRWNAEYKSILHAVWLRSATSRFLMDRDPVLLSKFLPAVGS